MHIKATSRGIRSILQHNTAVLKLNKSSKISERDWLQYFQLHAGKLPFQLAGESGFKRDILI